MQTSRQAPKGYEPLTYAYDLATERHIFNREYKRLQEKGEDFVVVEFEPPVRLGENVVACWPSEYVEIWVKR